MMPRVSFVFVALQIAVSSVATALAAEFTYDLKIEHGRVADKMRLIRVQQGDVVRLRCTTDQPLTLHLHGYDVEKRVTPGAATELTFTANATGRFPVHIHGQGSSGQAHEEAALVDVEVYPR
jgi:hypothetical protein